MKTELELSDETGRVETVSEFTRRVKAVLEGAMPPSWVRGEVSNLRAQASGHVYFSLKDAGAQLACVLFRGDAARQTLVLRDGQQVLAYGEVSVYEQRGQYQLIVRVLLEDGAGRLQQEFERLKERLAGEGLFAADRKIAIPLMPATVGFITSPTGAAVQDVIRILQRRGWGGRLVVLPAKVQGEGAAAEMIAMLEVAASLGIFDVLVIGRGGGSLEDLWAFNEEPLVRAVAACPVPIISAVGHEIDFTLCDFAADLRAETPSAAAELISSNFLAGLDRATRAAKQMGDALETAVTRAQDRLGHARSRLRLLSPQALIEQSHLRLDDLGNRVVAALRASVQARRQRLTALAGRFRVGSPEPRVSLESHRLLALWKRLQAASPASVLNRGFVIVRDEHGRPVARRAAVRVGQRLTNEFADGSVPVRAE
ncbi:MAG TPA: exodeoxyribonuclease VII large subunit [Opitutaceae bacterium]|nr:exodeoxyribonuclease VII large subunit [Opitutaceae bacterium]